MAMSDIMSIVHGAQVVFYLVGSAVVLMNIAGPLEELLFGEDDNDDDSDDSGNEG